MTESKICECCGRILPNPSKYKKVDIKHKRAKRNKDDAVRLHKSGLNPYEISEKLSLTVSSIRNYLYENGIKPNRCKKWQQNYLRDNAIITIFREGKTLEEIGLKFSITRERVRQIIVKNGIDPLDGGRAIRTFIKIDEKVKLLKERQERKNIKCFEKWGMTAEEYDLHVSEWGTTTKRKSPLKSFMNQRGAANYRKIEWNITFKDWWKIWSESGKWDQRGRGYGYCMARLGDSGAYEVGNVEIITGAQNASDSFIVHPQSERLEKSRLRKESCQTK